MPEHIFGAGTVRASKVMNLSPEALFPNPKVGIYVYIVNFISDSKCEA